MTIGDYHQEREGIKMAVQTIGIDLAKHVFQRHGVDAHGRVVLPKKLSLTNLFAFLANLPRCLIGMKASSGAHDWGRAIRRQNRTKHRNCFNSPQFSYVLWDKRKTIAVNYLRETDWHI
jgi:hypothetical protein